MSSLKSKHLLPLPLFIKRVIKNLVIGLSIIAVSLGCGMIGYRYFERMSWVDAYLNASMILSGMGPADAVQTEGGKIFAGSYALFSGIVFLVVIAVIFAPIFHRFLHKFIISQNN